MGTLQAHALELVGGRLCLDFVNTADWDGMACLRDHVTGHADLVRWGRHAGLLTEARAAELANATFGPGTEARMLDEALTLRQACRAMLLPGVEPGPTALARVQEAITSLAPGLRLWRADGKVVHAGPDTPGAWLLLPVAISTVELATSPARNGIGCCPGERCGWLFLDRSRNRQRVWCSMRTCGNRAKAKAHHARARDGEG